MEIPDSDYLRADLDAAKKQHDPVMRLSRCVDQLKELIHVLRVDVGMLRKEVAELKEKVK